MGTRNPSGTGGGRAPGKAAAKRPAKRRTAVWATPPVGPASPPPDAGQTASTRRPRYGPGALLGAALVLLAVTGLVLNFTVPWLHIDIGNQPGIPPGVPLPGAQTLDRADLKDDRTTSTYIHRLVDWPLVAFLLLMVAGAALVALDVLPGLSKTLHRASRAAVLTTAGYGAFLLALTGSRWLGIQIQNAMAPGDTVLLLHVVPYLNLALGLLSLGGVAWLLRGDLQWLRQRRMAGRLPPAALAGPARASMVVALGLLVLPLLTYTAHPGPFGEFHLGESSYANFAESRPDSDSGKAGSALGIARLMLWIILYVSVAGAALAMVERSGRNAEAWGAMAQLPVLNAVPWAVGVVFTVLAYVRLAALDNATITFNHVLPLIYAAVLVLGIHHGAKVFLPWFRQASGSPETEPDAAPTPH